jgi:cullin-4
MDFAKTWEEVRDPTFSMLADPHTPPSMSFQGISRRVYKLVTSADVTNIPPHPRVTATAATTRSRIAAMTLRCLVTDLVTAHLELNVCRVLKAAEETGNAQLLLRTHSELYDRLMASAQLLTASYHYLTHYWKQTDASSYLPKADCLVAWRDKAYSCVKVAIIEAMMQCVDRYWRHNGGGGGGPPVMDRLFSQTLTILTRLSQTTHRPLSTYTTEFETPFLERAHFFYDDVSSSVLAQPDLSLKDKIDRVIAVVKRASALAKLLHPSSVVPFKMVVIQTCVDNHFGELTAQFDAWLSNGAVTALHQLYYLVSESEKGLQPLLVAFEAHVSRAGTLALQQAATTKPDAKEFVAVVCRVYYHYHDIVVNAFQSNPMCLNSLNTGLGRFVNSNAWCTTSTVAAELCARYCHYILKVGEMQAGASSAGGGSSAFVAPSVSTHETAPSSSADAADGSPSITRGVASGSSILPPLVASSANMDARTTPIDDAALVFSLVQDKDVFQHRYGEYLAIRLLVFSSPNLDAERTVVSKIYAKSTHEFTYKWVRMINDYEAAQQLADEFSSASSAPSSTEDSSLAAAPSSPPLAFRALVTAHVSWPLSAVEPLPTNLWAVAGRTRLFDAWYRSKHAQRRLNWCMSHSTGIVAPATRRPFANGKSIDFTVSWAQASVLLSFGILRSASPAVEPETLSVGQIIERTGMAPKSAVRALQQLVRAKLLTSPQAAALVQLVVTNPAASSHGHGGESNGLPSSPTRSDSTTMKEFGSESAQFVAQLGGALDAIVITVNEAYTNPQRKVNLVPGATLGTALPAPSGAASGVASSQGSSQHNASTSNNGTEDRRFAIQSAIIRVMKSRKVCSFSDLTLDVIGVLHGKLFTPSQADVKANIEVLIEKDYLERDAADAAWLKYVA